MTVDPSGLAAYAAAPCPCGLAATYAACCGRYHSGALHLHAPTAEALMRSRYSAYALAAQAGQAFAGYLLATWHARTRPAVLAPDPPGLKWLGLEVRQCALQDATHATVEFVARSKLGGRAQRLHETSRFVVEDGRWFYLSGDVR